MRFRKTVTHLVWVAIGGAIRGNQEAIAVNLKAQEQFRRLLLNDTLTSVYNNICSDRDRYPLSCRLYTANKLIKRIIWFAERTKLINGVSKVRRCAVGKAMRMNAKCLNNVLLAYPSVLPTLVGIYNTAWKSQGDMRSDASESREFVDAMNKLVMKLCAIKNCKHRKIPEYNSATLNDSQITVEPTKREFLAEAVNNLSKDSESSTSEASPNPLKDPAHGNTSADTRAGVQNQTREICKGEAITSAGSQSPSKIVLDCLMLPLSKGGTTVGGNSTVVKAPFVAVPPSTKDREQAEQDKVCPRCDVVGNELTFNKIPLSSESDVTGLLLSLISEDIKELNATSVFHGDSYASICKELIRLQQGHSGEAAAVTESGCKKLIEEVDSKVSNLKCTSIGYNLYFEHFSNTRRQILPYTKKRNLMLCELVRLSAAANICKGVLDLLEQQIASGIRNMALYQTASLSKLLLRLLELLIAPELLCESATVRRIWLAINCSLIRCKGTEFRIYEACWMVMSLAVHCPTLDTVRGGSLQSAPTLSSKRSYALCNIQHLAFKERVPTSDLSDELVKELLDYSGSIVYVKEPINEQEGDGEDASMPSNVERTSKFYLTVHCNYALQTLSKGSNLRVEKVVKGNVMVRKVIPECGKNGVSKKRQETAYAYEHKLNMLKIYICELATNIESLYPDLESFNLLQLPEQSGEPQ